MQTETAYIPLKKGEIIAPGCVWFGFSDGRPRPTQFVGEIYEYKGLTLFRPVEVPVSEPEPDPYAELKAAFAAGKVIQGEDWGRWFDISSEPNWIAWEPSFLRIKPKPDLHKMESLLRQLVTAVRFHQHNEETDGDTASSRFELMYAAEEAHSFLTGKPMSFDSEEVAQ